MRRSRDLIGIGIAFAIVVGQSLTNASVLATERPNPQSLGATEAPAPSEDLDNVKTTRLLINVAADAREDQKAEALEQLDVVTEQDLGMWSAVEVAGAMSANEAEEAVAPTGAVEDVEIDAPLWNIDSTPNDTYYGSQWGLPNINAPAAWDITAGSSSVTVAVIDTGVDIGHSDLNNQVWTNPGEVPGNGTDDDSNGYVDDVNGWDFWNNDNTVYDPVDGDAHGTHVAGTIGAETNNGQGVAGVNWNIQLMSLKFLGPGGGWTSHAIKAINYAVSNGADIINASWGGGSDSTALKSAIDDAGAAGVLFVAAAGNSATDTDAVPHYPSSYDSTNIISVAAITSANALASFSNYGATSVDLGAPGSSILSTIPGNSYQYYSGTSMATPHVSGVAALVKAFSPSMSAVDIKNTILVNVDAVSALSGKTVTGGKLNAQNALTAQPPETCATQANQATYRSTNHSVGAVTWQDNLDVFGRGANNRLITKSYSTSWSGCTGLGGNIDTAPTAVEFGNALHVFARAADNRLTQRFNTGSGWSSWFDLGSEGVLASEPVAVEYGGALHLFAMGTKGDLVQRFNAGTGWSGWYSLGGNLASAPTVIVYGNNALHIFARAANNRLTQKFHNQNGWSGWFDLGGNIDSAPTAVRFANALHIFARATNDRLTQKFHNQSGWSGWFDVASQGILASAPTAAPYNTTLRVFTRGPNGHLYERTFTSDWTDWSDLGTPLG